MYGTNETMKIIGSSDVIANINAKERNMIDDVIKSNDGNIALAVINGFVLGYILGRGKNAKRT